MGTGGFNVDFIGGFSNTEYSVAADLDNNGTQDLAVTNADGDQVSILLGDGMGGFQLVGKFPTRVHPHGVVAADFNGDGHLDLAIANLLSGSVTILFGDGTGQFQ